MNTCAYPHEQCNKPTEGRTFYCASHNRLIRKEAEVAVKNEQKRKQILSQPTAPRAKPNKVSEKRKETNKEYFKLVEQFKKDNPECKAKVNEYCTKTTTDPHHRNGRGSRLLDVSTWLPVCRSCHNYIEAHPKEAKEKGWSSSRLATTEPHKI